MMWMAQEDARESSSYEVVEVLPQPLSSTIWVARRQAKGADEARDENDEHGRGQVKVFETALATESEWPLTVLMKQAKENDLSKSRLRNEWESLRRLQEDESEENSPRANFVVTMEFAIGDGLSGLNILGLEYCPGGDLYELLSQFLFEPHEVLFYLCEIMVGIDFLHQHNLLHADIKAENIALDRQGHVRIIGFGISKFLEEDPHTGGVIARRTVAGTVPFSAPEIFRNELHGLETDWWSFGVLAFEMLYGALPWLAAHDKNTLMLIQNTPLRVPEGRTSDDLHFQLIQELTRKIPSERLGFNGGFAEISRHPWFANVEWDSVESQLYEPPYMC